eukprot:5821-Chlamydomonas_euryale.AAC.1
MLGATPDQRHARGGIAGQNAWCNSRHRFTKAGYVPCNSDSESVQTQHLQPLQDSKRLVLGHPQQPRRGARCGRRLLCRFALGPCAQVRLRVAHHDGRVLAWTCA